MTSSEISSVKFVASQIAAWASLDARRTNWPVVYVIHDTKRAVVLSIYVGETRNVQARLHQRLASDKKRLSTVRVVVNETFNKSVCLDLEPHLIRWFSGSGEVDVLNLNSGITDADYFDRDWYRAGFERVFDDLRAGGFLERIV